MPDAEYPVGFSLFCKAIVLNTGLILHIWNFHLKTKIIRVFGACTILHKNALVTLTIVNKLKNVVIFMTSCIEIWQPIVKYVGTYLNYHKVQISSLYLYLKKHFIMVKGTNSCSWNTDSTKKPMYTELFRIHMWRCASQGVTPLLREHNPSCRRIAYERILPTLLSNSLSGLYRRGIQQAGEHAPATSGGRQGDHN